MMQDLAQSGQGVTALQFAGYVNGNSGAAQAFSKFSDYQSTFMPTAVAAAQGQLLAQDNGDTKSAVLSLLDMADPIFRGKDGWSDIKEGLEHLAEGDTKAFNASEFAEAYTKLGAGGKAWAVCAVMVSSINGANADQVNSMIYAFADAGGNVAEVGTGALQALADAGKFGAFSDSTKALAAFGAKLVPGLSVVANTAAFAHDFDAAKNGNPADALALLGDMDAVVGSVMTAFGAEVPGEVVTAIGVLSAAPFEFVGGIIEHFESQQEFQDEQVKYLKAAGLDDNSAELMAKDGSEINAFANQLGLSPSDAQQVLVDHPEAFGQGPGYTQGVTDVVKACQIKPQDVDGFLNALAKDNPNYVSMFFGVRSAENPAMPLANSANLVDLIGGGNYANAKAFIQSHAPEVFSAAGTAQRQADCDYENALSAGGSQQQQIGNLLKSNQSPAYQAEIIKVMKDNGTLNTWVQQMSNQYAFNGWPQAAASAIQNAQSAGVLSASQAQQYLGQLG